MPIQLGWDNEEKTAVRYDFDGHWTWEDFYHRFEEVSRMMDSVPHTVHVIIHMRTTSLPGGAISHITRFPRQRHPHLGMTLMVGASSLINAIYSTMVRIYPGMQGRFRIVATLEEARQLVKSAEGKTEAEEVYSEGQVSTKTSL